MEKETISTSQSSSELFAHDADIGIRGKGQTIAEAFTQAAKAMTSVITDIDQVNLTQSVDIECDAPNIELLFADWINALVFEMSTKGYLFGDFQIEIRDTHLKATVRGEPVDIRRHKPAAEIKGATFTELSVKQGSDGIWIAQCVVDV